MAAEEHATGRSTLGPRLVTALVLGPLVLAAVLLLPPRYFAPAFLLLAALALHEWLDLAAVRARVARLSLITAYIAIGYLLLVLPIWHLPVLLLVAATWLFAALVVVTFPASGQWLRRPPAAALIGVVILLGAWLALVRIHAAPAGPWLVLWLLALVWAADAGGYFFGRTMGRRKLAPAVSPGKTWEGALGGFALALVAAVALATLAPALAALRPLTFWLAIAAPLVVISVVGDLFESALKRERGVKDSGTLLPGHGGVLDRIDALLSTLPWFALILIAAGILQ